MGSLPWDSRARHGLGGIQPALAVVVVQIRGRHLISAALGLPHAPATLPLRAAGAVVGRLARGVAPSAANDALEEWLEGRQGAGDDARARLDDVPDGDLARVPQTALAARPRCVVRDRS